ncbi:hypothetical protein BST61_g1195 [Cercospora zeina]
MTPNSSNNSGANAQPSLSQIYSQVEHTKNSHAILGLQSGCTERDVKIAFRQLALLLHPDKCTDEQQTQLHTRLFVKIDEAKDALLNLTASNQNDEGDMSKSSWRNPKVNRKRGKRAGKGGRWEARGDGCYHWVPNSTPFSEHEPAAETDAWGNTRGYQSTPTPGSQPWEEDDTVDGEQRGKHAKKEARQGESAGAKVNDVPFLGSNVWYSSSGKQKHNLARGDIFHTPVSFEVGCEKKLCAAARRKKH